MSEGQQSPPADLYVAAVGRLHGRLADIAMEAAAVHCPGAYSIGVFDSDTVYVLDTARHDEIGRDEIIGAVNYMPSFVVSHISGGGTALTSNIESDLRDHPHGYLQSHVDAVISTFQKSADDS